MKPNSYARHRFPPDVIGHAVWLYLRFTLSYRDVEDLLAERGLTVSNESIRRWVLKFGPMIARNLRKIRPKADSRCHLDEMVVSIAGRQVYMWRAVDSEGEVLEILVQPQRDKAAAVRLKIVTELHAGRARWPAELERARLWYEPHSIASTRIPPPVTPI
jgi:putative transposase